MSLGESIRCERVNHLRSSSIFGTSASTSARMLSSMPSIPDCLTVSRTIVFQSSRFASSLVARSAASFFFGAGWEVLIPKVR